jgi:hypothetical protein
MTDGQAPPPLGQTHPFLVHIDHVGIHADDPAALFRFFAKDLGASIPACPRCCHRGQDEAGAQQGKIGHSELVEIGVGSEEAEDV